MEETREALIEQGFREYRGEDINVYFNTNICEHSGNCVRGNGTLFDLSRKPWIDPDLVDREEVKRVIQTCPSGALRYL